MKLKNLFSIGKPFQDSPLWLVNITFVIGFAVLIVNGINLNQNMRVLRERDISVEHTKEVLEQLELVVSNLLDAEAQERGFLLTGDKTFLDSYRDSVNLVHTHLSNVQNLTSDNPIQVQRGTTLEDRISATIARFDYVILLSRKEGRDAAREAVLSGEGRVKMAAVREMTKAMRAHEEALLDKRRQQSDVSRIKVDRLMAIEASASLLILTLAYFLIRRQILTQNEERIRLEREAWLKGGLAEMSEILRGDETVQSLATKTLSFLARYLNIPVATFYVRNGSRLLLSGSFAGGSEQQHIAPMIKIGDGLTGTAVAEKRTIYLQDVPDTYMKISSTIGSAVVRHIICIPLPYSQEINGVIELGALTAFTDLQQELLELIRQSLGVSLDAAQTRTRTQELLEETQTQAEELQSQQEELRTNNEELEAQTNALLASENRLQQQQEELRQTNEELEQQARLLEAQKRNLEEKNIALTQAQAVIEAKAQDLAQASQYKSDFLANMSHELRTPLNSLLILATLLSENDEGNLTEKQIEFAGTIHRAGTDLLNLISDILDLSKVEAGKLSLNIEKIDLNSFTSELDQVFRHQADQKNLDLEFTIADDAPISFSSDRQRLEQVLKNLLSNAIKFTANGRVSMTVSKTVSEINGDELAFKVTDTGIGIPKEKQDLIFEAFQQADGSTSRAYGGTGLGLTISRELSLLLGGRIDVVSEPGEGSTFTLRIPVDLKVNTDAAGVEAQMQAAFQPIPHLLSRSHSHEEMEKEKQKEKEKDSSLKRQPLTEGDTSELKPDDKLIIIIEDDPAFGRLLVGLARESGFKAIFTTDGESGLELIRTHKICGVVLDLRLPDVSGLSVFERLKADPKTRHLPIHIISGDDFSQSAMRMGAAGYLVKPVSRDQLRDAFQKLEQTLSRSIKRILIVEDDDIQRRAMIELLSGIDLEIDAVARGEEATRSLSRQEYDCLILDLRLPDMSGFDLLKQLETMELPTRPPVIVYTGKDLSPAEVDQLRRYSESIIIKGVKSPERLVDEVSLFLHRVESDLPQKSQAMLKELRGREKTFAGRRVLLVDDDMRNVFALANALDTRGIKVVVGKNGREAIAALESDPEIELVLMDIMMPVMDGYEAMKHIRSILQFQKLPIIALTAKAMKGDQEKCLAAGANDYLPKPVNLERLLSLLRVWLPRRGEIPI